MKKIIMICILLSFFNISCSLLDRFSSNKESEASAKQEFSEFQDESLDDLDLSDEDNDDSEFAEIEIDVPEEKSFSDKISEDKTSKEAVESAEISEQVTPEPEIKEEAVQGYPVQINNIRFLSNKKGGVVVIDGSDSLNHFTRYNESTRQYVIEIENAKLGKGLTRPFVTKDFQTSFALVKAFQEGSSVRVIIQLKKNIEPQLQIEGNSLLVMSGGVDKAAIANNSSEPTLDRGGSVESENGGTPGARSEKILQAKTYEEFLLNNSKFYGEKINIETGKGSDIRDIIEFISRESGANIVMTSDVEGKIQMKLREVPWDEALNIILQTAGLGYVRKGNVLIISKIENLQKQANAAKQIIDSQRSLDPLIVKLLPVSYATAGELTKQVESFLSPQRGKMAVDARTNTLIVTDTLEVIKKVEAMIKKLDVPPSQVMIEAKIIEASQNFTEQFGVNWTSTGRQAVISKGSGASGGDIFVRPDMSLNISEAAGAGLAALNLTIGTFDFIGDLTTRLSIEESKSRLKVISSPRILAMNNQAANIVQSGQVLSSRVERNEETNRTTTTYVPRTYSMNMAVTPQVTANDSVIMDINVSRQFPGAAPPGVGDVPVNSRSATTKALVKNGNTIVIGGIYQNDETNGTRGVPILRDIPFIGWLFKSKRKEVVKTELLVFLTPQILNPPSGGSESSYSDKDLESEF